MTDFDHAMDIDRKRAEAVARADGWLKTRHHYIHEKHGRFLVKDMDGWIDLCDNAGIEWEERKPPRSFGRIIYGPPGSGWWEYES